MPYITYFNTVNVSDSHEEPDGPVPISEEDLSEDVCAILDNYRLSVENVNQPYPPRWAITDILKAFIVYLNGKNDASALLMDDLDGLLFGLDDGDGPSFSEFRDKKSASQLIRGLSMLYRNIPCDILMDSLIVHLSGISYSTEHPGHMRDFILGKAASEAVAFMVTSNKVLIDHPYLDLVIQLGRDYDVVLTRDCDKDVTECLCHIMDGAVTVYDPPAVSVAHLDADTIIRARYESSFPDKMEEMIHALPKNRKMVVLDDCGLLTGSKKISQRTIDLLNRSELLSLNRFSSPFSNRSLSVAEISGHHSGIATRIRIFDEGCIPGTENIQDVDAFDDGMVSLGEIASVRKGTIVGKDNLITENDGDLAMYIRPKDVEKGELLIDDINYVTNDRHDSVMPDTVLVDSYPPFTRSYLVRKRDVPCIASPNFSIVVPNKDYLPDYVHAFFRSSMFVDRARRLSSGKYITLEDLKSIRIPIASKEVQQKIVDSTSSSANDPDGITSAFRSILSTDQQ